MVNPDDLLEKVTLRAVKDGESAESGGGQGESGSWPLAWAGRPVGQDLGRRDPKVGRGPPRTSSAARELGSYFKDSGKVLDSFEQGYFYLVLFLFCKDSSGEPISWEQVRSMDIGEWVGGGCCSYPGER